MYLAAGVYFRFLLTGPLPLTIRICKHRSPDANLSGIFLDRMTPLLPVPEMLTDDHSRTEAEAVAAEYAKLCGRLDAEQPDWPAYVAGLQHLQQSLHQTLGTLPNVPQAALQWVSWQTCKHLADCQARAQQRPSVLSHSSLAAQQRKARQRSRGYSTCA